MNHEEFAFKVKPTDRQTDGINYDTSNFLIKSAGRLNMRGSRNFRQGGPGQSDKKKL